DYGGPPVLRAVSFSLARGEGLVLLGPNGAGKSTLLRVLAGLHHPGGGAIRIEGRQASFREAAVRRGIGFVSHETYLYDPLTARENLRFFGSLYGIHDRERIDRALADAGLARFADRPVGSFSRGMAQRLTLARARLHRPPLWLLDEPFTGLDPVAAKELEETLRSFRLGGGAFLMATHDLAHVPGVGTRLLILRLGRIVHEEPLDEADSRLLEELYRLHAGAGIAGGGA
ncbi:MAG: heme ABC exporter ATP-binding protein CcmA, partial [Candidatus Eisenbacteria bacterium]|nr:heme ABC exporter ATP-binding protein CcmA [Candidatus Eisenbacteria bacterium]